MPVYLTYPTYLLCVKISHNQPCACDQTSPEQQDMIHRSADTVPPRRLASPFTKPHVISHPYHRSGGSHTDIYEARPRSRRSGEASSSEQHPGETRRAGEIGPFILSAGGLGYVECERESMHACRAMLLLPLPETEMRPNRAATHPRGPAMCVSRPGAQRRDTVARALRACAMSCHVSALRCLCGRACG